MSPIWGRSKICPVEERDGRAVVRHDAFGRPGRGTPAPRGGVPGRGLVRSTRYRVRPGEVVAPVGRRSAGPACWWWRRRPVGCSSSPAPAEVVVEGEPWLGPPDRFGPGRSGRLARHWRAQLDPTDGDGHLGATGVARTGGPAARASTPARCADPWHGSESVRSAASCGAAAVGSSAVRNSPAERRVGDAIDRRRSLAARSRLASDRGVDIDQRRPDGGPISAGLARPRGSAGRWRRSSAGRVAARPGAGRAAAVAGWARGGGATSRRRLEDRRGRWLGAVRRERPEGWPTALGRRRRSR